MAASSKKISDQRTKDARELALLIYDMFKESETNGKLTDDKSDEKT
jgi:hypothetical protein